MSNGVNKFIGIGHLGKDPELRQTSAGSSVANFSIAINETWKDKAGDKQERTEWVNIVMWGRLAEIAGQYLRKGAKVYLEGRIQTRKWQDKDGADRYSTEVVANELQMLDGRTGGHETGAADHRAPTPAGWSEPVDNGEPDDGIPF